MTEHTKERYDAIITRVRRGENRNVIAADFDITRATLDGILSKMEYITDPLLRQRAEARLRTSETHPCNRYKAHWRSCYGQGCYNKWRCDAYLNPKRRQMQKLELECTACGHEHTVNDQSIGYRIGDTIMMFCPNCQDKTENWITTIMVVDDKQVAA